MLRHVSVSFARPQDLPKVPPGPPTSTTHMLGLRPQRPHHTMARITPHIAPPGPPHSPPSNTAPPPLCACTALSKHGVGVEPPFWPDFWDRGRACARGGGYQWIAAWFHHTDTPPPSFTAAGYTRGVHLQSLWSAVHTPPPPHTHTHTHTHHTHTTSGSIAVACALFVWCIWGHPLEASCQGHAARATDHRFCPRRGRDAQGAEAACVTGRTTVPLSRSASITPGRWGDPSRLPTSHSCLNLPPAPPPPIAGGGGPRFAAGRSRFAAGRSRLAAGRSRLAAGRCPQIGSGVQGAPCHRGPSSFSEPASAGRERCACPVPTPDNGRWSAVGVGGPEPSPSPYQCSCKSCRAPPPPPLALAHTWSTARATAPSPGRPTPGVVKQDKSSGGSVDTTKTRSGPQRVRRSGGERPIGTAKGKQSDTEALCQPPPPTRAEDALLNIRTCPHTRK